MRISYLVLAHHAPTQLARLVERLTGEGDSVVLHVDVKSPLPPFQEALDAVGAPATFIPDRQNVRWGDFASVRAELACLRAAVERQPSDYYVLLSGVDYPIRPRAALAAELSSGATYLESWAMPDAEHHKPMSRLEHIYLPTKNRASIPARVVNNVVLRHSPRRNVARGLGGRQPYGGSQWWAFPADVARGVLDFTDREKRLVRFFSRSRNPDEMFFQTVVEALPGHRERRPPLTFADWNRRSGGSPATLGAADLPMLSDCGGYFARKFDASVDAEILDLIDDELLARPDRRQQSART